MSTFSQETNLVIQSACTAILITELNRENRLLESDFFKELEFLSPIVKDVISQQIGVGNQGAFLMILYALLVVPKELLQNKYSSEYDDINRYIAKTVSSVQTNYKSDAPAVCYVKHMRNAVAHAKVEIIDDTKSVVFYDNSPKGEHCQFEIPFVELIPLINKLLKIHELYAKALSKRG